MSLLENIKFENISIERIKNWNDRICIVVSEGAKNEHHIRQIDKLMLGTLLKILKSKEFLEISNGESLSISFPVGLNAKVLQIVKIKERNDIQSCRFLGGEIATSQKTSSILILTEPQEKTNEILFGILLKAYQFNKYKSKKNILLESIVVLNIKNQSIKKEFGFFKALTQGVYFCRDLINEPANVLNTIEFSSRLKLLENFGLKVDVLEEEAIEKLGMRALLAVGQGSESPSKVVVIRWEGSSKDKKPLLLLGKGVVFDSGGISIKPAGGMEEMTMDMSGAAVVAGTMKALALRQSSANVIGVIGLVENMPDGKAQRPGDVVQTMKGDTVEIINTDAEGRLVLCDLLWFAQTQFSPTAVIDVATLTGAVIVALGNHNAGVFSNNENICKNFLTSAELEAEGAWRLPLSSPYQKLLKSRVADIANTGGRAAGAVTAAKFLEIFVNPKTPWIHIDIAGVAFSKAASRLSAPGATGWGVASLNRLIYNYMEKNNNLND